MKFFGKVSILGFQNKEYVLVKTNTKNYRVLSLDNGKQYNIPRAAKCTITRVATDEEVTKAETILTPAVTTDTGTKINFQVGQIVRLKAKHATKHFPAETVMVVVKVNPTTIGIAQLNPLGVAKTATAPPSFLEFA